MYRNQLNYPHAPLACYPIPLGGPSTSKLLLLNLYSGVRDWMGYAMEWEGGAYVGTADCICFCDSAWPLLSK